MHENRSARSVWILISELAVIGPGFEAVSHFVFGALAIVITRGWALIPVSVRFKVHAHWEDHGWLLLEESISALGAAFSAFVKRLSCEGSDFHVKLIGKVVGDRFVEIAEGLVGEGAGQQAGSNERLLHLKFNYNKFVASFHDNSRSRTINKLSKSQNQISFILNKLNHLNYLKII